ncbi:MAG: hypothetical protein ACPGWR_19430 [Ardenticatenaceae bacterium]
MHRHASVPPHRAASLLVQKAQILGAEQAGSAQVLPSAPQTSRDACSTKSEQAGMRVLPNRNKQGCVFYQIGTSRDACSTKSEQAGMRVLPVAPEQGHDTCSTYGVGVA